MQSEKAVFDQVVYDIEEKIIPRYRINPLIHIDEICKLPGFITFNIVNNFRFYIKEDDDSDKKWNEDQHGAYLRIFNDENHDYKFIKKLNDYVTGDYNHYRSDSIGKTHLKILDNIIEDKINEFNIHLNIPSPFKRNNAKSKIIIISDKFDKYYNVDKSFTLTNKLKIKILLASLIKYINNKYIFYQYYLIASDNPRNYYLSIIDLVKKYFNKNIIINSKELSIDIALVKNSLKINEYKFKYCDDKFNENYHFIKDFIKKYKNDKNYDKARYSLEPTGKNKYVGNLIFFMHDKGREYFLLKMGILETLLDELNKLIVKFPYKNKINKFANVKFEFT